MKEFLDLIWNLACGVLTLGSIFVFGVIVLQGLIELTKDAFFRDEID